MRSHIYWSHHVTHGRVALNLIVNADLEEGLVLGTGHSLRLLCVFEITPGVLVKRSDSNANANAERERERERERRSTAGVGFVAFNRASLTS